MNKCFYLINWTNLAANQNGARPLPGKTGEGHVHPLSVGDDGLTFSYEAGDGRHHGVRSILQVTILPVRGLGPFVIMPSSVGSMSAPNARRHRPESIRLDSPLVLCIPNDGGAMGLGRSQSQYGNLIYQAGNDASATIPYKGQWVAVISPTGSPSVSSILVMDMSAPICDRYPKFLFWWG